MRDDGYPSISVVVVAKDNYHRIRRTIRHLRSQTIQDRLELIIVAQSAEVLGLDATVMEGFFGLQIVEVGAIPSVDRAYAAGIRRAGAPVIALVEDHAYPTSNWAEVLVEAHKHHWSMVASVIANANPKSMLSWASFLLSYGHWIDPVEGGEVESLPEHNVSYKRDVLMEYDAVLEDMLERESGFHHDLKSKGHRFYLVPNAKVDHLNCSRLTSVLILHFLVGRFYGATRAKNEHWSLLRRLLYLAGAPLIPLVRFCRLMSDMFSSGQHGDLVPRVVPAMMIVLIADAAGQAVGYALGTGNSLREIVDFEANRLGHVTERERSAVMY